MNTVLPTSVAHCVAKKFYFYVFDENYCSLEAKSGLIFSAAPYIFILFHDLFWQGISSESIAGRFEFKLSQNYYTSLTASILLLLIVDTRNGTSTDYCNTTHVHFPAKSKKFRSTYLVQLLSLCLPPKVYFSLHQEMVVHSKKEYIQPLLSARTVIFQQPGLFIISSNLTKF